MNKILVLIVILGSSIIGCAPTKVRSQSQGIKGRVMWIEGNQMPGPDRQRVEPKPVKREIVIHKVLKAPDLNRKGALFSKPSFKPVAVVETNDQGEFEVSLPIGLYSIFTRENEGLFANSFDSENNVTPVRVESGKFSEISITINYKAVY